MLMSQFAPNFAQKWKNGPCSHPWHYHYIFNHSILECLIHLLGFGYMIFFAHPTLCFIIFCISHGFEKIIFSHTFNPNFFLPSSPIFFTFLLYLYQKSAFANAVFRLCCHVSFKLFCCMIFSICAQNKWTDCLFTKRSSLGKFMSSAICSIYPYSVNVNRFPNHLLLRSHGL